MPDPSAPGVSDAEGRRRAILDAAGAVFLSKGYAAATTLEIARAARTSKRALYQLFANKRAVLNEIVGERSREMTGPIDLSPPETETQFFATVAAFGEIFLRRLFEPTTIALYRLAIAETQTSNDLGLALEANGRVPVVEAVRRFIGQGAARGWLAAPDLSSQELDALTGAYFDLLIGWLPVSQLLGTEPVPDAETLARRAGNAADALKLLANDS